MSVPAWRSTRKVCGVRGDDMMTPRMVEGDATSHQPVSLCQAGVNVRSAFKTNHGLRIDRSGQDHCVPASRCPSAILASASSASGSAGVGVGGGGVGLAGAGSTCTRGGSAFPVDGGAPGIGGEPFVGTRGVGGGVFSLTGVVTEGVTGATPESDGFNATTMPPTAITPNTTATVMGLSESAGRSPDGGAGFGD